MDTTQSSDASVQHDPSRLVVVTLRNPAAPSVPRAGSTIRGYDAPTAYSLAPATRINAKAIAMAYRLRETDAWPIGLLGIHCVVFELPPQADRDETLDKLRRDQRVESAQPMQSFDTLTTPSNDPYRGLQRNLDLMDVTGAHLRSLGEGVRVAVIDTGIDAKHPDLAGRISAQKDFVGDGKGAAVQERHGTAVAGIIAAVENNQQGIIGIAPAAQLYALRACWSTPSDPDHASCSTLTLAKAIAAAIETRIDIVNLSLAGPADPLLSRLVAAGLDRGVLFVGANPPGGTQAGFPTSIAGVINVDSSSRKRSTDDAALFAPGDEVLTLVPDGRYDFLSGSSLAAASVSGGIALLLAKNRGLRADDARRLLAQSSRSVSTAAGTLASVNLCAALASLIGGEKCKE
jgi:subtilisin family serine protease